MFGHPSYIFYRNRTIRLSNQDDDSYQQKLTHILYGIAVSLKISPFSILLVVSRDVNTELLTEFLKLNRIKKIYFIIDDVFQVNYKGNISIDCSILEQYQTDFSIVEFDFISSLLNDYQIDNEVLYCEDNLGPVIDKYPKLNFRFYDLASVMLLSDVFSNPVEFNFKNTFKYKMCCFNYRPDVNRTILVSLLYNNPDVFLTAGKMLDWNEVQHTTRLPFNKFSNSFQAQVKTGLLDIEKNNRSFVWDFPADETFLPLKAHWNVVNIINDSFCNIISETKYDTYTSGFSEKTLKAMLIKRPFMLVAAPGTLALLKKLGFRTFDQWWDESYDLIEDHNLRLESIHTLIQTLLEKSFEDLEYMLHEMQPILIHNFENLQSLHNKMIDLNNFH